jgi:hypothetical protein
MQWLHDRYGEDSFGSALLRLALAEGADSTTDSGTEGAVKALSDEFTVDCGGSSMRAQLFGPRPVKGELSDAVVLLRLGECVGALGDGSCRVGGGGARLKATLQCLERVLQERVYTMNGMKLSCQHASRWSRHMQGPGRYSSTRYI